MRTPRLNAQYGDWRTLAAIGVAIGSDLLDWVNPVFLAPVIGDPLDIITIVSIFYLLRDWRVGLALFELFPFGDVLPMYTLVSLYVVARERLQHKEPELVPQVKKTKFISWFFIALIVVVVGAVVIYGLNPQLGGFSLLP